MVDWIRVDMFEINKCYLFRVKNTDTTLGYIYYTGKILEESDKHIWIYTKWDEKVGINKEVILNFREIANLQTNPREKINKY